MQRSRINIVGYMIYFHFASGCFRTRKYNLGEVRPSFPRRPEAHSELSHLKRVAGRFVGIPPSPIVTYYGPSRGPPPPTRTTTTILPIPILTAAPAWKGGPTTRAHPSSGPLPGGEGMGMGAEAGGGRRPPTRASCRGGSLACRRDRPRRPRAPSRGCLTRPCCPSCRPRLPGCATPRRRRGGGLRIRRRRTRRQRQRRLPPTAGGAREAVPGATGRRRGGGVADPPPSRPGPGGEMGEGRPSWRRR